MRRELHPNWTALAANLLPAQSRQAIRASWCRETAFDPSWWTEENPERGQCGVTAALIYEISGLPVICGRATLPDGTVESFYWNAGVDLAGRQYPQDAAPAAFLNMLRYKAEEAGSEYLEANTRRLKPSQRCPDCGTVRKKGLSDRQHDCSCGCSLGRDQAAALVLLRWGLEEVTARAARIQPGNGHPAGTVGVSAAQAA